MQQINRVEDGDDRRGYAQPAMNRIKELREAVGLTQEDLAERLGTTANHIYRLENGRTKLNTEWMVRLADALACSPAELLDDVAVAEIVDEVELIEANAITRSIGMRGLRVYRVLARSVSNAGIQPGDTITVDESDEATKTPKMGDVVLVEMGRKRTRVLRQFMPPAMLVTNRGGANLAITLDHPTVDPMIVGVVLRDEQ